jgi:hypothetical protein
VKATAYLLPAYCRHLPSYAVCLCVVDPGVGGDRRGLIVEADGRRFVGPDNGLLSLVIRRAREVRMLAIRWQPVNPPSATFHGRDWFAPVAAKLARGEPIESLAVPIDDPVMPDWPDDLAEIVYIDRYGNAVTGLRATALSADTRLVIGGRTLSQARTFSDRNTGECFWYENSNGLIELAANLAPIGELLHLKPGESFQIEQ